VALTVGSIVALASGATGDIREGAIGWLGIVAIVCVPPVLGWLTLELPDVVRGWLE